MDLKRITSSLLFKIVVAIILGIACSFFFPVWLARVFATFNGLFGNFLGFVVPVLIFALITPAIAGLGRHHRHRLPLRPGSRPDLLGAGHRPLPHPPRRPRKRQNRRH